MLSKKSKKKIVILGDSTIDNRVWLGKEKYHLYVGTTNPFLTALIDFVFWFNPFKPKSVVENLRAQMPDVEFIDRTNDGFTTSDLLKGAYRDKAFGSGVHRMFPHEFFKPLDCADLDTADQIIISVGGNNFREFIQVALSMREAVETKKFIEMQYPKVFQKIRSDYQEILKHIAGRNPKANIILMTQYYPALTQKTLLGFNIYDFMSILGNILNTGDAQNTILKVMNDTYSDILQFVANEEWMRPVPISVVDVTSSLNPHLSENYVGQIEPSDVGGKRIAEMLAYAMQKSTDGSKKIYRFSPDFFTARTQKDSHVYTCDITSTTTFIPVHPSDMEKPSSYGTPLFSPDSNAHAQRENVEMEEFGMKAAKGWVPYLKSCLPYSGAYNNEDFKRGYSKGLEHGKSRSVRL